MKLEKIHEFAIDQALNPSRRKAVEKHIADIAPLADRPLSYGWDDKDDHLLRVKADPALFELRFEDDAVVLFGGAPLWARLLFTAKKKQELRDHIEEVLHNAKFILPKKVKPAAPAKAAPKAAPKSAKKPAPPASKKK